MNTDSKPSKHEEDHDHAHRYHDDVLRRKSRLNTVAFVITALTAVVYLVWAFRNINYGIWYVAGPYLLAELICFGCLLLWSGMMIHRRDHPPGGLPLQESPPPVDIIVTCCGEPMRVVEKTLRAVAAIEYPDVKVTVADDRADPEVGELCEKLGFIHLCRPDHENRKAGNLNHALKNTTRPFLLVLDSDQIPHRSILKVLMGYFTLPQIGFVTTYQSFDVPKKDPWGNRDRVFYGAMQPARNDANSAISCGTGVIYRRAPYAIAYLILNRLLTDKRHTVKTFRAQVGLFQVFFSATLKALFSHNRVPKYAVNQKLVQQPPVLTRLYHVMAHIVVVSLCVAAIIFGYLNGQAGLPHYLVNMAWAAWVVWLLLPFIVLALKTPPKEDFR